MSVPGRLKDLPEDVREKAAQALIGGEAAIKVVEWLQGEKKVLTDIKPQTLRKMLDRYRSTDLRDNVFTRISIASANIPVNVIVKRINSMTELEELVEIQKKRVQKLLDMEDKTSKLVLKNTTEEIKVLQGLLVQLGFLQLETGVIQRAPKTIRGSVVDPQGGVTEFSWSEEQEKLYKELDDAYAAAKSEAA
jgi:hypothetical protein